MVKSWDWMLARLAEGIELWWNPPHALSGFQCVGFVGRNILAVDRFGCRVMLYEDGKIGYDPKEVERMRTINAID